MALVNSCSRLRFPVARIFGFCCRSLSSPIINPFFNSSLPHLPRCNFSIVAHCSSSPSPSTSPPPPLSSSLSAAANNQMGSSRSSGWRPMCLYYTQGKCTKMDDPSHLEKFNHDCSRDLQFNPADNEKKCSQDVDFFLVLDLEGKVEILEFPVLLMDAKSLSVVDFFHRFVRPSKMSEQAINKYIEGKYGEIGVDRVWHDTAQPFEEVIQQFEAWLTQHHLWEKKRAGCLTSASFVTCGNWDLKTKVPQQCIVSGIKLPPYFMEWINLKDVYLNFYGHEARGMTSMLKQLRIPLLGSHHLGIDDTKNIARVLQHMLADGALMQITARRNPKSQKVEFLFENRIEHPQRRKHTASN
ncbi:hypothetical protein PTKIN_Ptkin11bG0137500 [Pterospermum kingtungense]